MFALRRGSLVVVLLVVIVCGRALAGDASQRFSAIDQPVSVERTKLSASTIKSCLGSKTTYKVRINSVSSNTTSFRRVFMDMSNIDSDASKLVNGTSQHIGICAKTADAGGFTGFSFVDGLCTMFSLKNPPCRCDAGSAHLIYVQDSFWPKPGTIVNRLISAADEQMEYVRFPRTVFDQLVNLGVNFYLSQGVFSNPPDITLMEVIKSISPGSIVFWCNNGECRMSLDVDTAHCSMGCDSSSNLVVRRQFTHLQEVVDEIAPRIYFSSECGNTVTLNFTFPVDATKKTHAVISHKGYGCKWYSKDASDHECAVKFRSRVQFALTIGGMGLDGNASTCEGDSLTIYNGAQADGVILAIINPCNKEKTIGLPQASSSYDVIFKRSARQYTPNGFNLGFFIGPSHDTV